MKKIILVCSAGMSTSILVEKMKTEAKERGIEVEIEAYSNVGIQSQAGKWDVALLGPQIRFAKDEIEKTLNIPTEVIDMKIYGMGDGAGALDQALGMCE